MILQDSRSALCESVFNITAVTAQASFGFSNAKVPTYKGSFTQGCPVIPITKWGLAAPTEVPGSRNEMALQRGWSNKQVRSQTALVLFCCYIICSIISLFSEDENGTDLHDDLCSDLIQKKENSTRNGSLQNWCIGFGWQGFGNGGYRGGFSEKLPEAFPLPDRANASWLQDGPTAGQGQDKQWLIY